MAIFHIFPNAIPFIISLLSAVTMERGDNLKLVSKIFVNFLTLRGILHDSYHIGKVV